MTEIEMRRAEKLVREALEICVMHRLEVSTLAILDLQRILRYEIALRHGEIDIDSALPE